MQEHPQDQLVVIAPAGAVQQGPSPLSLEAIRARPNMPAFELDEPSGALTFSGLAQDGSGDVSLIDEGGQIVMRGNYAHNLTVNIALKHLLQMKGWERITLSGNEGFCRELAYQMVSRDVPVDSAELMAHVSARMQRERRRELLTAGLVYLFFSAMALAIPAFFLTTVFGELFDLLQKNLGYALGTLVASVFLLRMASRWITGRA